MNVNQNENENVQPQPLNYYLGQLNQADTMGEIFAIVQELRLDGYLRDDLDDEEFPPNAQNLRPGAGQVRANLIEIGDENNAVELAKEYLRNLLQPHIGGRRTRRRRRTSRKSRKGKGRKGRKTASRK